MSALDVGALEPLGLLAPFDQLATYQGHHHALFLDQTIGDALGGESWAVRKHAAFEASRGLLLAACAARGALRPAAKLEVASDLLHAMGHGRLRFEVSAEGGRVVGEGLHHGASHAERVGRAPSKGPVDAFGAGFAAAAVSLAFPSDWGLFDADEVACVARRDARCVFVLARRPERTRRAALVTRAAVEPVVRDVAMRAARQRAAAGAPADDEAPDPVVVASARAMGCVLAELASDEEGRIRAFGVGLALTPVGYTDSITYDTMHLVERRSPALFPVYSALAREAATMGAFHLLGGVVGSAGWSEAVGGATRDPERLVRELAGITRALGWGSHAVVELRPGARLVVRAATTHESVYYALRHGATVQRRLVFLQGMALAFMHLADRAREGAGPIGLSTYDSLFEGGPRYRVTETRSTVRGDDACEVVVERA